MDFFFHFLNKKNDKNWRLMEKRRRPNYLNQRVRLYYFEEIFSMFVLVIILFNDPYYISMQHIS